MGNFGPNNGLVILKDHSADPGADINGDFDLSGKFSVIEYEEASPQSVKITLNAKNGRFQTIVPIIKKWDRLYVELTDRNGKNIKDVFHVKRIKRIQRNGIVTHLKLICPHQTSNLWKRTISFPGERISGNTALAETVKILNANRGAKDPLVEIPATFDNATKTGNMLDSNTANDYIFESSRAETAINEIKEVEQQPIEGGGSFEAVYIRFKSKYNHVTGTDLDVVQLQAFPQGFKENAGNFTNVPSVTLKQTTIQSLERPNVQSLDSDEDPEEGTNLIGIGEKTSGSYPVEFMKWVGAKDVFDSARQWADGQKYKRGHLVIDVGITYECLADHTAHSGNRPLSGFWTGRIFAKPILWVNSLSYPSSTLVRHNDIAYKCLQTHTASAVNEPPNEDFWVRINFVPTIDYSPLTKDKAQFWVNALGGAKHAATNNAKTAMIDKNVIIPDKLHPRTYVRYVNTDPASIPSELKVDGNIPDGFRMLVIDPATGNETGAGAFAGNDRNGLPFAGNIADYFDEDNDGVGQWVVFKGSQTNQDQEIYDWYEGDSWTKNPCTGFASYVDPDGVCQIGSRGTQWKKGSYGLSELPLIGKIGIWFDGKQFECVHSVKWDSTNSRIDMGNEKIIDDDDSATSAVFIKSAPLDVTRVFPYGVGLNIFPLWPPTSNTVPFGGTVSAGEKIKLPVFDFNNMYKTHEGKQEWFGPQVEDYYPIQGYAFTQQFTSTHLIFGTFDTDGDYKFEIWLADRRDQVMVIPYTHKRNEGILPGGDSLTKMEPYVGVPGVSAFFAAKEPENISTFNPRKWIIGGIFTKDSFDSQGRYTGVRSRFNGMSELKLSVDQYRMTKPVVATNIDESNAKPDRNIEPLPVKQPSIISYSRLKNLVLGLEKLTAHERREFKVTTRGRLDVDFGDPVYYTNSKAIEETTDTFANTVKTVADKIIITLSKPKGKGPGGMSRVVHLITRVWP